MAFPPYTGLGGKITHYSFLIFCACVFLFLIAPILVIIPLSFNAEPYFTFTEGMMALDKEAYSVRWYKDIATNPQWIFSAKNSIFVATFSTLIATVLGTLAALGLSQSHMPYRPLIMGVLISPMIVPLIISAAGMFFFYSKIGLSQLYSDFSLACLADFSLLYYNSKNLIKTSFLVRNVGYQIIPYTEGNTEKLPFELTLSFSNKLKYMPLRWSVSLQHLENWDLNFENSNQNDDFLLNYNSNIGDEFLRHVVLGLEFLITKNLNIRFGYNNRKRHEMMILDRKAMVGFSYGFSFKINKFKFNYGRGLNHFSGPVNSIGITTNISNF